jgi:spore coat polysaccharide biosynthesis protein SpsF
VRQTADNAFADPDVAGAQVRTLVEGGFDYVGIKGWPIGIAAEACWMAGLETADREATDAADREHVMPFLYRHPDRFRVGVVARERPGPEGWDHRRYTIDTEEDLLLAREIAKRLGHGSPVRLGEVEAILEADPALLALNAGVVQVPYRVAQERKD